MAFRHVATFSPKKKQLTIRISDRCRHCLYNQLPQLLKKLAQRRQASKVLSVFSNRARLARHSSFREFAQMAEVVAEWAELVGVSPLCLKRNYSEPESKKRPPPYPRALGCFLGDVILHSDCLMTLFPFWAKSERVQQCIKTGIDNRQCICMGYWVLQCLKIEDED